MEKQNFKFPVLNFNRTKRGKSGCYLVSADVSHKEKYTMKGSGIELIIPRDGSNNLKDALPNECTVEAVYGDVDFAVGTKIYIDHFILMNHDRSDNHIFTDDSGKKYWKIENINVYAGIVDGKLVPNSDVLICEYVVDKLLDTFLHLADTLISERQDVAKVVASKDEDYPEGCFVLVEDYALYEISFDGKKYAKVELGMDDVIAIVSDPTIRKDKVLNTKLIEE